MSMEEQNAKALRRIAEALETIVTDNQQRDREAASFAGLVHSDIETLMYAVLFAIPPLIHANPNIDADAKVEMIQRIFELSTVHQKQVKEATSWAKNDSNAEK